MYQDKKDVWFIYDEESDPLYFPYKRMLSILSSADGGFSLSGHERLINGNHEYEGIVIKHSWKRNNGSRKLGYKLKIKILEE